MGVITSKRTVMTLYTNKIDIYSHQVRIVLAEKGVNADVIDLSRQNRTEELFSLNPYGSVPTLLDRELVLYRANIIMEYLDERFPHPPLMPVYPVLRAKCRLMMHRIEKDWYTLVHNIEKATTEAQAKPHRKQLLEALLAVTPIFADSPYFLSDEFSLVDCCLAPMLWRLPLLGIELPASAKAIAAYAKRVFSRDSFRASLTEAEKEIQEVV